MLGYEEEKILIKDDVRVVLVNIGEGFCGDYRENDPEDVNLLRFEVSVSDDGKNWNEVEDSSYCTLIPADSEDAHLDKCLSLLMQEFFSKLHNSHDTSVKKLGEGLSWIN